MELLGMGTWGDNGSTRELCNPAAIVSRPRVRILDPALFRGQATWYRRVRFMKTGLSRPVHWLTEQLKKSPGEAYLYALFAGLAVLLAACWFYSSMRLQTLYSVAWSDGNYREWLRTAAQPEAGPWSAPLDDVFIHFDFARSAARGHPFEWSVGNGYSSGDTSLLYPFIIAIGYLLGFHENLMYFAAIVACVSLFGALLAVRSLFRSLPAWTSYLGPVVLLCIGALDWTFFSGMEVALFIGLWGISFVIWDEVCGAPANGAIPHRSLGWLGISGAFLVATRPEAVTTVAVLSITALWSRRSGLRPAGALLGLALAAGPGALVVISQTLANYFFTGETAAAGAIAKLELYHPYLTLHQVWDAWRYHVMYQARRITEYHFSEVPWLGWLIWLFGAVPLIPRSTRRVAVMLWASLILWAFMVGLNGQVRWQNERYAMPAVAWLLLLAALGLGVVLARAVRGLEERRYSWVGLGVLSIVASAIFGIFQVARFRDQVWFFGRASRNIWDQHVSVGRLLGERVKPRRVLVGDAGAIPYVSDRPALDIIGLGGYSNLPFARATRLGVAAAIELIGRIPNAERPDLMAIYPSWWGDFPLFFGREIAEVPVRGNVIAGGASKVLYVADWSPLWLSDQPHRLTSEQSLVDSLDFADLVNEKAHGYLPPARGTGYVSMKILTYADERQTPVWDAARIADVGERLEFTLQGLKAEKPARIVVRVAPLHEEHWGLSINGQELPTPPFLASDHWQDVEVPIPETASAPTLHVTLTSKTHSITWYHLWLVQ